MLINSQDISKQGISVIVSDYLMPDIGSVPTQQYIAFNW